MARSFHHQTTADHRPAPDATDMSFLHDVHPEVTDTLLGFVYDPLDPAALDDLLSLPDDAKAEQRCAKKPRAQHQQVPELMVMSESVLPLPPVQHQPQPLVAPFVGGADGKKKKTGEGRMRQRVQSAAARERRNRISAKTTQLSRLIPGGHKLNTAEMLEEAARHVKLLQAQVGMLALMHTQKEKVPVVAQEQMHALLVRSRVQERLAAEGKCVVPRKLVDAVTGDEAVKCNALVSRDLGRFMASLDW